MGKSQEAKHTLFFSLAVSLAQALPDATLSFQKLPCPGDEEREKKLMGHCCKRKKG